MCGLLLGTCPVQAINVEVAQGPGMPHRLITVLLDYTQMDRKAYLGGFRNKKSNAVYHHAATQTPRAPKYAGVERKLTRETQTVKAKKHSQQTVREYGTQMERPGVLLDTGADRCARGGAAQGVLARSPWHASPLNARGHLQRP